MSGVMSGKQLEKVIFEAGFRESHNGGGHQKYVHPDGRSFSIPDLQRPKAIRGSNAYFRLRSMLRKNGVNV